MFKQIALAVPLAAALAIAAPACVLAATAAAPMPSPGQTPGQSAAPTQSPAPPFSIAPATPKSNGSAQLGKQDADQSLAARLSQSNGTIHPPPVDPGMTKVPPQTGTMPVVKPPPNVQSK